MTERQKQALKNVVDYMLEDEQIHYNECETEDQHDHIYNDLLILKDMTEEENKEEKVSKRFCSYCGSQMIEEFVGAENYDKFGIPGISIPNGRYDELTGKRNIVKRYVCPKKTSFNLYGYKHDDYALKEENIQRPKPNEGKPFTKC